ncbi:MAG: UDP-glucuronate 4-epimerase, partial [Geotoga sp.]|nr:UDP-glucuronate 4-epimerase [Geotoga sp.]
GNKKVPFSEDDKVDNPVSLYAATKKSNELMAHTYHHLYGTKMVGLRFFTVYGEWGRPDMAYFKFAKNILLGNPIDVYNYGNMERDFTYISDIVDGILSSIEKDFDFEVFNLGNSKPVKLMYFIELIEKYLNKEAEKNFLPMQDGDVLRTYADLNKSSKLLNYNPKVSIEEGLKRFCNWFLENREWLLRII